jgi:hypothetical protein
MRFSGADGGGAALPLAALRELRGLIDAHVMWPTPLSETVPIRGGEMKRKQPLEGELDLLVFANSEAGCKRLEPMVRAEVTGLLRFLLDECIAEAVDE